MSEMKTLTLNGKTYDSFPDQEARERINELKNGGTAPNGSYAGKKFIAFGTSAVSRCDNPEYNGGFLKYIQDACGFTSYTNAGVSGIAVTDSKNGNGILKRIRARTDLADYAVIFIWCCGNDFVLEVPVGVPGSTSETVFTCALKAAIEHIQTNAPAAEIILLTTTQSKRNNSLNGEPEGKYHMDYTNSVGKMQEDYINACIRVGNKYGVPVVDLFHNSGITPLNYLTYMESDGSHHNATGYERVGQCIVGALNNKAGAVLNPTDYDQYVNIDGEVYDLTNRQNIEYKMILDIDGARHIFVSHLPFWFYPNGDGTYSEVYADKYSVKAPKDSDKNKFTNGSSLNTGTAIDGVYKRLASSRTLDCIVAANFNVREWGTGTVLFPKSFN